MAEDLKGRSSRIGELMNLASVDGRLEQLTGRSAARRCVSNLNCIKKKNATVSVVISRDIEQFELWALNNEL